MFLKNVRKIIVAWVSEDERKNNNNNISALMDVC